MELEVEHFVELLDDFVNRKELTLLGHTELTLDMLRGYEAYLHEQGTDEVTMRGTLEYAIAYSTEEPLYGPIRKVSGRIEVVPIEPENVDTTEEHEKLKEMYELAKSVHEDFKKLTSKYPDYVPNANDEEIEADLKKIGKNPKKRSK